MAVPPLGGRTSAAGDGVNGGPGHLAQGPTHAGLSYGGASDHRPPSQWPGLEGLQGVPSGSGSSPSFTPGTSRAQSSHGGQRPGSGRSSAGKPFGGAGAVLGHRLERFNKLLVAPVVSGAGPHYKGVLGFSVIDNGMS